MKLIPTPKKLTIRDGFLKDTSVILKSELNDYRLTKAIEKIPKCDFGSDLYINVAEGFEEKYTLEITQDAIVINADSAKGAFWAIQTLRQPSFALQSQYCG